MKKAIFAVALLTVAACHKKSEPATGSMALPIEVATPIVRDITLTREYPGYLDADATISIMAFNYGARDPKRIMGTLKRAVKLCRDVCRSRKSSAVKSESDISPDR